MKGKKPHVLTTTNFITYAKDNKKEKHIKVIFFTERKLISGSNYKESLAMLLVMQIPISDDCFGKEIREIPQCTKTEDDSELRIYRDIKKIAEVLESITSICKDFHTEYSTERATPNSQYTIDIENYEKIFRNNLNTYRFDRTIKNLQKNKENEIEEEYVDDEYDDFLDSIIIEEEPPQAQEKAKIYNFTGRKADW